MASEKTLTSEQRQADLKVGLYPHYPYADLKVGLYPLVAGLLLAVAAEGPDFGHYTDWAAATLSGDIFMLRGNVLSPGGVPFTIAAAGPGLLFAVAKAAFVPLTLGTAALLTGWISAVVFWCCALVVLRRVAHGSEWLTLFGAAALFIGTHAGLYSHVHATEVFADALIAALWALALTRERWRLLDSAAAGALAGLLLIVRAHVVLYAVPALWLAAFAGATAGRGESRATSGRAAARMVVTAIPLAIALGEYVVVNRWMTGSLLHPPYVYGGAGFSSVDLRHPQLAAVLVHPWHGLLSYHPLYGVAFAAVAMLSWRAREWRVLWIVTLLAAIAHVWVQAGWYIWWLGGSTFGMRGMAPAALPLVAGLIATIRQDADDRSPRARIWVWATLLSCAWSYPLLLRGYSGFVSWDQLLAQQTFALGAIAVVLAFLGYAALTRSSDPTTAGFEVRVGAVAGIVATVGYLIWELTTYPAPFRRGLLGLVAAVLVLVAVRWWRRRSSHDGRFARYLPLAAPTAALVVFAVQAVFFARLAVRTERHAASGAPPPREFAYVGASPVDELRVTYAEYLGTPGFEPQKRAFRRFLAWQRIAVSRLAPQDRQIAESVRQALDAEPAFGDTLVEVTAHEGAVHFSGTGMSDAQESRARHLAASVPGVQSVTFSAN